MPEFQTDADFLVPDWPAPANVRALVTTRSGGVSGEPWASFNLAHHVGDATEAVTANRALLRARLPSEPVWLNQVHGVHCVDAAQVSALPTADASFSTRPGVVCAVLTADCLPVLLCAEDGRAVGVAHAGWRGLADGVIEALVARLREQSSVPLLAWLGPAIGPAAFQVGPEVRERFTAQDAESALDFVADREGRYLCDLFALARRRLAACGVSSIVGGGICTASRVERFFSYRREGRTGRFATCVWLT